MIVYLNGKFLPIEEAQISVLDRGFLFGEGIYEVIPVFNGKLFRWQEHWQRLKNSLNNIRLSNPLTEQQWLEILQTLITRSGNSHRDQAIYLQITRGAASKREHHFPKQATPTVYALCEVIESRPPLTGVKAITCPDVRWLRCDIKSIALLPNVLARQQAVDVGAVEAILIRDGYVTEGAASNVFIVSNGIAMTPPKNQLILAGITRDLILELMQAANLPYQETNITVAQLRHADEIWLTSSTREILAVIDLDGAKVGQGQPNTVWSQVFQLYQEYKNKNYAAA
jgi:D-alanine transaminase